MIQKVVHISEENHFDDQQIIPYYKPQWLILEPSIPIRFLLVKIQIFWILSKRVTAKLI